ncbi:ATP-binding protein [Streptosporangium soli]|nr:HAMP domain-containing histidine kinase [Streptosporangium sp. KLBMP 9127]
MVNLRSSVRLRATIAATMVVAVALGVTALVLFTALQGSLQSSLSADAVRRAEAAVPAAVRASPVTDPDEVRSSPATPARTELGTTPTTPAPAPTKLGTSPTTPTTTKQDTTPTTKLDTTVATPALVEVCVSPEQTVTIVDPDVRVLATTAVPASPAVWAADESYALASVPIATDDGEVLVQARASLGPAHDALATLNQVLLPGIPVLLLIVAGTTWFTVGRALAPVSAIRAKVADITARDLHQRVPVPGSKDEIAALARTVNATLDRLESAVGRHKRFVADAAHELRSPIATLRTRLELAGPPEGSVTGEALVDVLRLQSLSSDLLLLARLDAAEPIGADDVDLGQVAAEEALRVRPRPDVRVRLDIAPDVVIRGSRGHLARLVVNLVDNAVRHAASIVLVRVTAGDQATLEVSDDGPGIPAEHREAVFDRFTRLDEARARDAGGSGLGLAIARDITACHDGTLTVTGHSPGACLRARFPLAADSP